MVTNTPAIQPARSAAKAADKPGASLVTWLREDQRRDIVWEAGIAWDTVPGAKASEALWERIMDAAEQAYAAALRSGRPADKAARAAAAAIIEQEAKNNVPA
jgi:hypothetical protein